MSKTLPLRPRISEKAYGLSLSHNTYVFDVPKEANRQTVAAAVSEQYNVTVAGVNISNVKGKVKRSIRKGGRSTLGKRVDTKKAYVTLQAGDSLPIFAAEEDAKKAAKKEKK